MKPLTTEMIAGFLHTTHEAVRIMVRTGSVSWGVYVRGAQRNGRGKFVYYPYKFADATGIPIELIEEAMA